MSPGNILSLVCDKGGCAKTITAIHLASGLARLSRSFKLNWKVLLVDMDPQSTTIEAVQDTSRAFSESRSLAALLTDERFKLRPHDFIETSPWVPGYLFYLPSDQASLEGVLDHLSRRPARDAVLRRVLRSIASDYHFVVIDSGGRTSDILVRNAITAATQVIVPINADYLGLEAVPRTNEALDLIRQAYEQNTPALLGYLLTIYRTNVNASLEADKRLRAQFGAAVFDTVIPQNSALSDAIAAGQDIFAFRPGEPGAHAYRTWLKEVIARVAKYQAR